MNSSVGDLRRPGRVDRRRAARQDDRLRVLRQHLRDRHRVRDDLGVDPGLADPAGDELGVLRAEVDDEDQVVFGAQAQDLSGLRTDGQSIGRRFSRRTRVTPPGHRRCSGRDPDSSFPPRPGLESKQLRGLSRARSPSLPTGPWVISGPAGPRRYCREGGFRARNRAAGSNRRERGGVRRRRRSGAAAPPARSGARRGGPAAPGRPARRPTRAAAAGPPRPCWARTTSPAPPGR